MQGLLIANKIINVIIILVMIFAVVITSILYDMAKKDKEAKLKLCKKYSKIFLALLIISVILFAYIVIGYSLLIALYDPKSDDASFSLIGIVASAFSIVLFFKMYTKTTIEKKKNKNNEFTCNSSEETLKLSSPFCMEAKSLQTLGEDQGMIELKNSLVYFKENSHSLIEKYAYTVENLIDKLTNIYSNLFLLMFDRTNIPMANMLMPPYKTIASPFLGPAIRHDGLDFDHQSKNDELNRKVQNVLSLYVEKLKEEIRSNKEWDDERTLPLLIYKVIRDNIIKHYHDKYVLGYGYNNLEELCQNVSEPVEEEEIISYLTGVKTSNKILIANKIAAVWFIYYYIYEHDINLPFVETYKKLCLEMKNIVANQEKERIKNELFGGRKIKVFTSDSTERYISPIEKIDHMTGEEFELFMTQYFAEHGFKATHTPLSGDYGIDLILENDFVKIGVQAKCYSNKVTLSAIQEVVAGLRHYGLSSGMVVTNNYFQPSAIQLAKENNITLWDRNKLIEKLGE